MTFQSLKQFLHEIPFNSHVGFKLVRLHKDGVTIECPLRPELMNGAGVLHGGVTATLADVAVGMALARHLGRPRAATTVEMKINASGEGRCAAVLRACGDRRQRETAGRGGPYYLYDSRQVSTA